jgi:hypothetical protein
MQVQGTNDLTVPYNGTVANPALGNVQSTLDFWIQHNGLDTTPAVVNLPNTNTTDNSTVTKSTYSGNGNIKVVMYTVNGGSHTWPGAALDIGGLVTNHDLNASQEIWDFFKNYQHDNPRPGTIISAVSEITAKPQQQIKYYPNPFRNQLSVETGGAGIRRISIYNVLGNRVLDVKGNTQKAMNLDTSHLSDGVYFLNVETTDGLSTYRVVK